MEKALYKCTTLLYFKVARDILHKKVEEVSFPLNLEKGYIDESEDILRSILNDDVLTDSDGEINGI